MYPNTRFFRRGFLALAMGLLVGMPGAGARPGRAAYHLAQFGLLGEWSGSLRQVAWGQELRLTVAAAPDGRPVAVLEGGVALPRRTTMTVAEGVDSVRFSSVDQQCSFVAHADGQQLRGVWRQPGLSAQLVLERVPLNAHRGRVERGEHTAGYALQELAFSSPAGPTALGGTLSQPAGNGPFAAVLLLPDALPGQLTASDTELLTDLTDYLTQHQVAVLRLDGRGQGRSGGKAGTAAPAALAADVAAALAVLRTRPGIDPLRVGLLGHGFGANVALLAASQTPGPAFVVALAASGQTGQEFLANQGNLVNQPGEPDTARAARLRYNQQVMTIANRFAQKQLREGADLQQTGLYLSQQRLRLQARAVQRRQVLRLRQLALLEVVRQTPDNGQAQAIVANMLHQQYLALPAERLHARAAQLTSPEMRQRLAFDPRPALAAVRCPVLLLTGADDDQTPPADNLAPLHKALKVKCNATARELPGLDHNLTATPEFVTSNDAPAPTATVALEAVRAWVAQQSGR